MIHGNGGRPRWSDEHYLIADLFRAWTGKDHPARPQPPAPAPTAETRERERKVAEIEARFAARRRAIEAGEIR